MSERTIGIVISGLMKPLIPEAMSTAPRAPKYLSAIRGAEDVGIKAVWSPSATGEVLTLFTAAAAQTDHIRLGTSIAQIWSRHPVSMAQEAGVAG